MGRRYGRNQRRRHRERIAELEVAYERERRLAAHYVTYKHRHEDFLREFCEWWDHCVLCEPQCIVMSDLPPEFRIEHAAPPQWGVDMAPPDVVTAELTYSVLRAVEIAARDCPERLTRHVVVRLPSGVECRYYIDARDLRQYCPEDVKRQIAKMIVTKLCG